MYAYVEAGGDFCDVDFNESIWRASLDVSGGGGDVDADAGVGGGGEGPPAQAEASMLVIAVAGNTATISALSNAGELIASTKVVLSAVAKYSPQVAACAVVAGVAGGTGYRIGTKYADEIGTPMAWVYVEAGSIYDAGRQALEDLCNWMSRKGKKNQGPRTTKRKGSAGRQPHDGYERNVGDHGSEEHSRIPKGGPRLPKR